MSEKDESIKEVIYYRDGTIEVETSTNILKFSAEAHHRRSPTRQPEGVSALDAPAHSSMGDAMSASPIVGDWADPAHQEVKQLQQNLDQARAALRRFSSIKADDGDDFSDWPDDVIVRCEIAVGDIKAARAALGLPK